MKLKVTMIITAEFEVNPTWYQTNDPKIICKIERDMYEDEPERIFDRNHTITVEVEHVET